MTEAEKLALRCMTCFNMTAYCTCPKEGEMSDTPELVPGDEKFERKLVALAQSRGWSGYYDEATVTVLTNDRLSGYSEYTVTNSWEEITVVLQHGWAEPFVMNWDNEDESREYGTTIKSAMTKLIEDLDAVK